MTVDELVQVGEVLRPFGIRGEVKVRPSDSPEQLLAGFEQVYLLDNSGACGPVALEGARRHGANVLLKLAGYDTPESAGRLRNVRIAVPYDTLPALPDGHFYFCDLLGARVELLSGRALGTVEGYIPMENGDLLVVRNGDTEHLVPTGEAVVLSFDREARRLVVAWDPEATGDED